MIMIKEINSTIQKKIDLSQNYVGMKDIFKDFTDLVLKQDLSIT